MKKEKLTLDKTHPEIAKQWHSTLNGNKKASDYTYGSHYKAWWFHIADTGSIHEWDSIIKSRTILQAGCSCCDGKTVCLDNSLAIKFPEIAKQWHPIKNGNKTPYDFTAKSGEPVWWFHIDDKGNYHEWESKISNRTTRRNDCSCCNGKTVCLDNSLAIKFPEIAKEWHPTKNTGKPSDYTYGSRYKAWWFHYDDDGNYHEWDARIKNRTVKGNGCSCCRGLTVCLDNCLATKFPEIAKEWHPTKNGDKTPYDFTAFSNEPVWWFKKKCGHEWLTKINNRTSGKTNCPKCNLSKGELKISNILNFFNITFLTQKYFKEAGKYKWDFGIEYNNKWYLIEFHGIQHYEEVYCFTALNSEILKEKQQLAKQELTYNQKRDQTKLNFCESSDLVDDFLIIPHWNYDNIEEIIKEFLIKNNLIYN